MPAQVEERIDGLYALPPEEFTAARNALATELRRTGERDEAETVKRLPRPTVAAWIVNQLSRRHRREVQELIRAGGALRSALRSGRGDVREATATERRMLHELLAAARSLARQSGRSPADAAIRAVADTLRAAAADEAAATEVLKGRLARELEATGFGVAPGEIRRRAPQRPSAADKRRGEALKRDRQRVAELRREARAAEQEAERARRSAEAAQRRVEQAQAALAEAEDRLRRAQS